MASVSVADGLCVYVCVLTANAVFARVESTKVARQNTYFSWGVVILLLLLPSPLFEFTFPPIPSLHLSLPHTSPFSLFSLPPPLPPPPPPHLSAHSNSIFPSSSSSSHPPLISGRWWTGQDSSSMETLLHGNTGSYICSGLCRSRSYGRGTARVTSHCQR